MPPTNTTERRTMNKYQDNDGRWIGPRDDNGRPKYEAPVTITVTAADGDSGCAQWAGIASELFLPDEGELREAVQYNMGDATITVEANGITIQEWKGIDEDELDGITEEIHDAILNA